MVQPLVGNWSYPTAIRFGAGRIRELPDAAKAVGLRRPLLVTDPGLARLPMIADALLALRKAGVPVEANVAAILRPMCPDFPRPVMISRPFAFLMRSAASLKADARSVFSAAAMA